MEQMNIGQVAEKVGIQTSAIRFYESIGLLPTPPRKSGWRRYGPEVLDRLGVIVIASQLGFKLEEIRMLLDGFPLKTDPSERWRALAVSKLPEVRDLIARATLLQEMLEAGVDCRCDRIEECITTLGQSCRVRASDVIEFQSDGCGCDG